MESSVVLATGTEVNALGFDEFFEAQHVRLARALFFLTANPSEADDIAQEALVRVYERWDRVSRMDSPEGYLFRTALNLHRSRVRWTPQTSSNSVTASNGCWRQSPRGSAVPWCSLTAWG